MTRRILTVAVVLVGVALATLVISYEIIGVDFVGFMEDQPAIDYQDPPRRLPPEEAVPLSRPAYLDDEQALANPEPADEISLQRGGVLFDLHCAVCHGQTGQGDGPVTAFWREDARQPPNLTEARVAQYPDGSLFGIISRGIGTMPPLRENLTEEQRWDVINYLRTLQP